MYQLMKEMGWKPGTDLILSAILKRIQADVREASKGANLTTYSEVMSLMTRFIKVQSPKIDTGIKVLGIEEELDVPFTLPSGRLIYLYGYIDLVYKDPRGNLRIRDHKTGGRVEVWTKDTVQTVFQLLFYGAAKWLQTKLLPTVEISFLSTHEYKGEPPPEAFGLYSAVHTEIVYKNFLEELGHLIDEMLDSRPTPHRSNECTKCPFYDPCRLELKGVSVKPLLATKYQVIDRNAIRRPIPFTQNHSNGTETDSIRFH